jgi:hypothetical protein
VTTDLSFFDLIVPCGIPDVRMTSVQRELGIRFPRDGWNRTVDNVILGFSEVFDLRPQMQTMDGSRPDWPDAPRTRRGFEMWARVEPRFPLTALARLASGRLGVSASGV